MSDISRTTTGAPPQRTQQQQEQSVSQEQARQENQQRFAQKLKEERDKKSSAKEKDKSHNLSNVVRQASHKAQKPSEAVSARDKSDPPQSQSLAKDAVKDAAKETAKDTVKGSAKDIAGHPEEKGKSPSDKADAILQGLQPQASVVQASSMDNLAVQETQQTSASVESSNRLFEEFQTVADRVMHTSQSLQQGGSVRLQLSNNVLPGTSVTFSMVAGALHVTFSGNNKKSLAKVREHEAGLVAHVRQQSGVDIVVATEDEQEPDQQQGGSP